MVEQPVNLSTAIYLGVFSRAEQRVLQAIFKATAEGGEMRCHPRNARPRLEHKQVNYAQRDHPSGRNRPSEKTERRSYCAVSLSNILTYGEATMVPRAKATDDFRSLEAV
jgi:hypothetical protein